MRVWCGQEGEKTEKLASFFGTIHEFMNPVLASAVPVPAIPLFPSLSRLLLSPLLLFPPRCRHSHLCHLLHHALLLELRPMASIGRPEASNTRVPS